MLIKRTKHLYKHLTYISTYKNLTTRAYLIMKLALFITLLLPIHSINAEQFSLTGKIDRIGSILTREESDFIIIEGATDAGTCPKSSGLVTARIPYGESGSRAYALALSAKMANKEVSIAIDDTNKHTIDGGCILQSISISD